MVASRRRSARARRGFRPAPPTSSSAPAHRHCTFPEFVSNLELFLAAFSFMSRRQNLAVLAHGGGEGGYLYPTPDFRPTPGDPLRPAVIKRYVRAGLTRLRYGKEAAAAAAAAARRRARGVEDEEGDEALDEEEEGASSSARGAPPPSLDGLDPRLGTVGACLSAALCYAHKQRKTDPRLRARIVVFQCAPDAPAHYISVINAVCSAARFGVPVDSVLVGRQPSVFLQQAASLTSAQHLRPEVSAGHFQALFQYLVMLLLPDARARQDLLLPPQSGVNLRAHCFCHKQHRTMAWLCYVCLSIWCKPEAVCPTCGTSTTATGATAGATAGVLKG
jgi:hypothetical protein